MANLKNNVNPLTWNVPITNSDGTPTNEFMRKWAQQAFANGKVPDLVAGQALHTVFAASPSGPSAPPAFRLLAVADIPSLLSLYDAAGAAAAALTAAEAFSSNAGNLTSGTVPVARLPLATGAAFGAVKPDGVTITIAGGVISAVAGGSGGGAASIQDDGTNVYLAISDGDGQLVLDGAGDPVFMPEVFPVSAIPLTLIMPPTTTALLTVTASTYTAPVGCIRLEIVMKAAGGGSNSQGGANPGADGGDVSFNAITGKGGKGATSAGIGTPGAGGTGGAGTALSRKPGQSGFAPSYIVWDATTNIIQGGHGGGVGAPAASSATGGAATAAGVNTGCGASGANTTNLSQAALAAITWAAGGGEGEEVTLVIDNPSGAYAYTVPDGGAGGVGGTSNGAKGGSGKIVIREYYGSIDSSTVPHASTTTFGTAKPDGTTITAALGVLSAIAALPTVKMFYAQMTANQVVADSTWTKAIFDTFITNTLGTQYNNVTGKFTPLTAGKWAIWSIMRGQNVTSAPSIAMSITKNGTWSGSGTQLAITNTQNSGSSSTAIILAFAVADLNGSTDWVEVDGIVGFPTVGATPAFTGTQCFFGAVYLGP